jgi:multiple sugar transport system substrate-binding protein
MWSPERAFTGWRTVTEPAVSRRTLILGGGAGALAALAACGRGQQGQETQPSSQTAPTIDLRHIPQNSVKDGEAFRRAVDDFNQRQSRIRVIVEEPGDNSYVKFDTLIAAGTPPDAAWTQASQWPAYLARGALLDLTPIVQRDRSFPADRVYPKVHDDQTKFRGRIYVVPNNTGGFVTYFNKEMFDRAGVPYPKEGWTWDDYFHVAEKLTTGTGDQKQFGGTVYSNYKWNVPWTKQINKEGWDRVLAPTKCLLDDAEIVDAMRRQAELRTRFQHAPMPADNATFANGRVAMVINGEWNMWDLRQAGQVRWDMTVLPKGKRAATLLFVQGNMVSVSTKHPDEVWEWLKELTGEQAQRYVVESAGRMPITPELAQKLFVPYAKEKYGAEHPEVALKQWEIGTTYVSSDLTSRLEKEALDPGMKQIMEGQVAVAPGLAETARLANEILKSSKFTQ